MQKSRYGLLALSLAFTGAVGCGEDNGSKETADGAVTENPDGGAADGGGGAGDGATGQNEPPPPNPCVEGPFAPVVEPLSIEQAPPIVFVHGFAGSAQQFQAQAMRFDVNGYSHERIFAYDHHGGLEAVQADVIAGIDALVDEALAQLGVEKVILVGHSRGTSMSNTYMGDAARLAKVAKYISLDGGGCGVATELGVECIAPNQLSLPGQYHVEVASSPDAFVEMFKFIVGAEPAVKEVLPQEGKTTVTLSGRVVDFPANTGKDGATLKIFEIDPVNGQRANDEPVAEASIGADGDYGPVELGCGKYYEKELALPGMDAFQHFYGQPYTRDTNFERLLSAPPDAGTVVNTNLGDDHAVVVLSRMREWCGGDELFISTTSEQHGDQEPVNALTPAITDACEGTAFVRGSIGIHIHDGTETPGVSSLMPLPWFPEQPFQDGVDVFMPAADPPDGTITFRSVPRGFTDRPQVLKFPNWQSSRHRISVLFNDYHQ